MPLLNTELKSATISRDLAEKLFPNAVEFRTELTEKLSEVLLATSKKFTDDKGMKPFECVLEAMAVFAVASAQMCHKLGVSKKDAIKSLTPVFEAVYNDDTKPKK